MPTQSCGCFATPHRHLFEDRDLGRDDRFADISLMVCSHCGQRWLRYFYEVEAFTASGRWYLGPIGEEEASALTAENAKATLERLPWYFYGGSYFSGRSGRTSGAIALNP